MKDNRGEISIQMIITVIVLIVMGGICIFMLTGENGIFVTRKDNETVQEDSNTVNTNETQEQNVTNNENGALTVPIE